MKALVTGVAGFIGSRIAHRLLEQGFDVVGVDSMSDYYDSRIKTQNLSALAGSKFTFVLGDLNHLDLNSLVSDQDFIFHQAGQPGVRKSWGRDFGVYAQANIEVTQKLLESAKNCSNLKKFVYASSSSIYGDASHFPSIEKDLPNPISPYGVTKLAAEHLCVLYARNFNIPTVSLRYFTVYGPGQRPDMAFTKFLAAAIRGNEIKIFGDGEQIRDFTYVDDLVSANLLAAVKTVPFGSVFNVSGGTSVTVNYVLDMIAEVTGQPLSVVYLPPMAGDAKRTGGDSAAMRDAFEWTPSVGLREGLSRQRDWLISILAKYPDIFD